MFPKQLTPFPLPTVPPFDNLAAKIADVPFTPVTGLNRFNEGFAPLYGFDSGLTFTAEQTELIRLKRQEKMLPSSVIQTALNEYVAKIEANEARKVGRKEKQELKEKITDDLLPRALCRESSLYGLLNDRYFFAYTASPKQAEHLLSKLREAMGGLNANVMKTKQSVSSLMTDCLLHGSCVDNFKLGDECKLHGVGEKPTIIKISRKNLTDSEVVNHVRNGMISSELELIWRDQIAFVLTEKFCLKKIQWLDRLQANAEESGDDARSLAFAQQLIANQNLTLMLDELVECLGGLED